MLLPAIDGGYALIGCREAAPGLFDGVRWSTDSVYRLTDLGRAVWRVERFILERSTPA